MRSSRSGAHNLNSGDSITVFQDCLGLIQPHPKGDPDPNKPQWLLGTGYVFAGLRLGLRPFSNDNVYAGFWTTFKPCSGMQQRRLLARVISTLALLNLNVECSACIWIVGIP